MAKNQRVNARKADKLVKQMPKTFTTEEFQGKMFDKHKIRDTQANYYLSWLVKFDYIERVRLGHYKKLEKAI